MHIINTTSGGVTAHHFVHRVFMHIPMRSSPCAEVDGLRGPGLIKNRKQRTCFSGSALAAAR